jgi:hypothetical protein
MDTFAPIKDEASRRHPDDRDDSDAQSDIDSNATNDDDLKDEDYVIPGTGAKDMPLLKSSSKLTGGSYQTVRLRRRTLYLFSC